MFETVLPGLEPSAIVTGKGFGARSHGGRHFRSLLGEASA